MEIKLRETTIEDFEDFYKHKCEDSNIYWCNFEDKPNKEELRTYFTNKLKGGIRKIYAIINADEEYVGYIYIDNYGKDKELSLGIIDKHQRKGVGSKSIKLAINLFPDDNFFAFIYDINLGSKKAFEKNGFKATCDTIEKDLIRRNERLLVRKHILNRGEYNSSHNIITPFEIFFNKIRSLFGK